MRERVNKWLPQNGLTKKEDQVVIAQNRVLINNVGNVRAPQDSFGGYLNGEIVGLVFTEPLFAGHRIEINNNATESAPP